MNDEYFKEQSNRVRAMADKADPFTKKRLLALAESYDARLGRPSRATPPAFIVAIDDAEEGGDCGLIGRNGIEVTHRVLVSA
jgi:hypothetical protein